MGIAAPSQSLMDLAEMEVIHGVVRITADRLLQRLHRFCELVALDVETPEQVEVAALATTMEDGTLHVLQRSLAIAAAPGMAGKLEMHLGVVRSDVQRRAVEVFG